MSRLIDADALIEEIWKKHKETEEMFDVCVDELKEVYCGVVSTIDEQPTAYDVEKVVEQLEEESYSPTIDDMDPFYDNPTKVVGLKTAIKLVRKGGVDHD